MQKCPTEIHKISIGHRRIYFVLCSLYFRVVDRSSPIMLQDFF